MELQIGVLLILMAFSAGKPTTKRETEQRLAQRLKNVFDIRAIYKGPPKRSQGASQVAKVMIDDSGNRSDTNNRNPVKGLENNLEVKKQIVEKLPVVGKDNLTDLVDAENSNGDKDGERIGEGEVQVLVNLSGDVIEATCLDGDGCNQIKANAQSLYDLVCHHKSNILQGWKNQGWSLCEKNSPPSSTKEACELYPMSYYCCKSCKRILAGLR